ncbi:DUF4376 domain-containing protein [Neorhizobium galegae]|uniref:DUF4376 domain-containing protein n=1 Tax=Neorhizobium galegae TaxID=399 RepID=A0A6A1TSY4_NEOGA|nr:DUF4376 domain-containing protein [Neorhizobium galegae]KAB1087356.1 DUF4376 domain-containing protein [Neorhizobium galegae]
MKIFHYDPDTGLLLGEGVADRDPLDNPHGLPNLPWLIPAFATTIVPPAHAETKHRVFRDGAWGYVPIDDPDEEPLPEPLPTTGEVDTERDRRITAGFIFEGVLYQSDKEARENIMGAHKAASDAMMLFGAQPGNLAWQQLLNPEGPAEFKWISADNTRVPMDAPTVLRFGYAALTHKSSHIFAASDLKSMDPIPSDFATNPVYWPAAT